MAGRYVSVVHPPSIIKHNQRAGCLLVCNLRDALPARRTGISANAWRTPVRGPVMPFYRERPTM
jgi:hypothetical protein